MVLPTYINIKLMLCVQHKKFLVVGETFPVSVTFYLILAQYVLLIIGYSLQILLFSTLKSYSFPKLVEVDFQSNHDVAIIGFGIRAGTNRNTAIIFENRSPIQRLIATSVAFLMPCQLIKSY